MEAAGVLPQGDREPGVPGQMVQLLEQVGTKGAPLLEAGCGALPYPASRRGEALPTPAVYSALPGEDSLGGRCWLALPFTTSHQ